MDIVTFSNTPELLNQIFGLWLFFQKAIPFDDLIDIYFVNDLSTLNQDVDHLLLKTIDTCNRIVEIYDNAILIDYQVAQF